MKQIKFKTAKPDCAPVHKNEQAAADLAEEPGSDGHSLELQDAASLRERDLEQAIAFEKLVPNCKR